MIRPLTFALAPWRSGTAAGGDRNQEQEVDCAISDYSNAIESNPHNPTPYFARGTAHLKALNFDSAIAARHCHPNHPAIELNRSESPEQRDNLTLLGATPER